MDENVTVFVVDDDEAARQSVCALVESMGVRAESFESAEEFLAAYDPQRPGCLVTDVRMLGMSGVELQEQLMAAEMKIPVVMITAFAETPVTVRAMKNGAMTFLEKPCRDQELWDAIRAALNRDAERRESRSRAAEHRERLASLTPHERAVMNHLVDGKMNKVIAKTLDVSLRTVEARRRSIFDKTGTRSIAELVRLVVETERV